MRRRILSIQGGGVNGIFAAKILAEIECDLEKEGRIPRVGRYFDLITGTSTGGLIALGLALEIPAAEIVKIYQNKSTRIFPGWRRNFVWKLSRRPGRRPIYNPSALIKELKEIFKERTLSEATSRLLIPAFNQSTDSVHLFKTAHHKNFVRDHTLKAWDIAAATAAAPFYFPPHRMETNASFLDGGVWANNPMFAAIAEAIQYCHWDREQLDILSISGVRDVTPATYWQGLLGLPGALVGAQVKGSAASAKTLVGDVNGAREPHGKVFDLASDVPTGSYALDDARSVWDLLGKADTLYRSRGRFIQSLFFSEVAEEFQPCIARNRELPLCE